HCVQPLEIGIPVGPPLGHPAEQGVDLGWGGTVRGRVAHVGLVALALALPVVVAPAARADVQRGGTQIVWTQVIGGRFATARIIGPFDQVNGSARSGVLWSSRLDGSDLRRLSEPGIDGVYEDYRARFAPGGYVIFLRVRDADIHEAVFRMRPDGTQVRQLTPW